MNARRKAYAVSRQPALRVALALALWFSPGVARAEDKWWARDKALHFSVSAGLAAAGYGAASFVFDERAARAGSGAALALGAGVAKEAHDSLGYGDPSWKDLTWDVAGTAAGLALAWALDLALSSHRHDKQPARAGIALSF